MLLFSKTINQQHDNLSLEGRPSPPPPPWALHAERTPPVSGGDWDANGTRGAREPPKGETIDVMATRGGGHSLPWQLAEGCTTPPDRRRPPTWIIAATRCLRRRPTLSPGVRVSMWVCLCGVASSPAASPSSSRLTSMILFSADDPRPQQVARPDAPTPPD